MKIGFLGSGNVARTLATKLVELGHEVKISSRDVNQEKDGYAGKMPSANDWARALGAKASAGNFDDAASFGEVLINAASGAGSIEAIAAAGYDNIKGKILVDIANPLDFSKGTPPSLSIVNTNSLGETIQKEFSDSKVVKTLNMVSTTVMVNPNSLSEETDMLLCGNDSDAKKWVAETLLKDWLGWKSVIDLGDITNSRGMEMYLPLWLRLMAVLGTPNFNIKLVKTK